MWRPSKMILICQSEGKSEIRKSGLQVKRHKEVRCSVRGKDEEGKESVMVRDTSGNESMCSVQIVGGGGWVGKR